MSSKLGTRVASLLVLALLGAFAVIWANSYGGFVFARSSGNMPGYVLVLLLPLLFCWIVFMLFRQFGITTANHLALLIAVTIGVAAFAWQPWSLRVKFYRALKSVERGMSEQDARRIMSGYLDANLQAVTDDFVPDDLHDQGVTHCLSYRWSYGDFNADVAQIFLKQDTVVGSRFLPD